MAEMERLKWWKEEEPHKEAWTTYRQIKANDSSREEDFKKFTRLYGNKDVVGYGPTSHAAARTDARVTLNIVKAVSDTVVAKIAKHKPRPRFLTNGGNWTNKRKAKLLQRWMDMQFYTSGVYKEAPKVVLDACVYGTGAMKVRRDGTKICVERVFPAEIVIDYAEGLYQKPRQVFHRKYLPRETVLGMIDGLYGPRSQKGVEIKALIGRCNRAAMNEVDESNDSLADLIEIVEGWHLPSYDGADDGRHVLFVENATISEEKWDEDYFPIVFIRWSERLRGFWGQGLAEDLQGIQVEINRLLQKIQKAFHLLAVPQIWLERMSGVRPQSMDNEIGKVNTYTGKPPVVITPPTISAEIFNHLENLYRKGFEQGGLTPMSASSSVPAGLESGAAIREWHDVGTERFSSFGNQYEDLFMDLTKIFVSLGRQIAKENPNYTVVAHKDRNTIAQVKWKDVNLEQDAYVLQIFPASSLPTTPAGRLAAVQDMLSAGLLDPTEAKRLLNFPDLEEHMSLDQAVCDNIERLIEKMLDEGEYETPEPFMDTQLALKKTQAAYERALQDGVPEDRLALLRQFMLATKELIKRSMMEQQNLASPGIPGAPPGPGPSGAPMTAVMPQDGQAIMS